MSNISWERELNPPSPLCRRVHNRSDIPATFFFSAEKKKLGQKEKAALFPVEKGK